MLRLQEAGEARSEGWEGPGLQVWRLENSFGRPSGGAQGLAGWCTETIVLSCIRQIFYDSHKLYLKQVLEGAAASTLTVLTWAWVMLVPRLWTGQSAKMVA